MRGRELTTAISIRKARRPQCNLSLHCMSLPFNYTHFQGKNIYCSQEDSSRMITSFSTFVFSWNYDCLSQNLKSELPRKIRQEKKRGQLPNSLRMSHLGDVLLCRLHRLCASPHITNTCKRVNHQIFCPTLNLRYPSYIWTNWFPKGMSLGCASLPGSFWSGSWDSDLVLCSPSMQKIES